MTLPTSSKPFPIPVVSALGPGSQGEENLDYITMPSGMTTYAAPRLPEPEDLANRQGAVAVLHRVLDTLRSAAAGEVVSPVLVSGLESADLDLLNQVLGEGEVSARIGGDTGPHTRIQESVFAGVWRVIEQQTDGALVDRIEVGAVPSCIVTAARADARSEPPPMNPLPMNVLNGPAVLQELAGHRQHWRAGQTAEVVNFTLLPLTLEDIAYVDHQLGTGRVLILSRGYGNCRITNCCVDNTWRVVYYNSQDAVILNSAEVCAVPEVACAAPEDLQDSLERFEEVLQWVESCA